MKIGLFTEFSYPGKSEGQAYAEVLEQIALADELGYDFFSTTESFGKDEVSCSPFPLEPSVVYSSRHYSGERDFRRKSWPGVGSARLSRDSSPLGERTDITVPGESSCPNIERRRPRYSSARRAGS